MIGTMNSIYGKSKSLWMVLAFSFVALSASAKDVFYVKSGANGDGSSWSKAFGNIQQAVDSAAKVGADVWVAKGVYKSESSAVVTLKPNVSLYGGFAGTETSLAARDTAKNPTVLDGDAKIRVINQPSEFEDASAVVVDGFTIQNGVADYGGGAYLRKNSTINNCILRNNAASYGLAIYARSAKIKNSIICDNRSANSSRTVCLYASEMDNCVVKNNEASCYSVMYADNSSVSNSVIDSNKDINIYNGYPLSLNNNSQLINCEVKNDYGQHAGIYAYYGILIKGCSFSNNESAFYSVFHIEYDSKIEDCEFFGNKGNSYEIFYLNNSSSMNRCKVFNNVVENNHHIVNVRSSSVVSNSLIYNNKNTSASYVPLCLYNNSRMENTTFADNETGSLYGVSMDNSSIVNSIVVGTKFVNPSQSYFSLSGTNTVSYSMIEGGFAGEGNIAGSKDAAAFVDPDKGNYSLSEKSYCINRGKDTETSADLLGNSRKQGGAVDMGAIESRYEKANVPSLGEIIYVKKGSKGDGSSWTSAFGDLYEAMAKASYDGKKHQIWVAAGTYYGDTTIAAIAAFPLGQGVCLYGGFAGNETSLAARDTAKNPTILDGQSKKRVIGQSYAFADSMAVVVDGFTIQNGYAANGGGVNVSSNVTVNNCILRGNCSSGFGSAIYADNSTVKNCRIVDNIYTGNLYYAVFLNHCVMDNCEVKGNRCRNNGAIRARENSTVTNCLVEGNFSDRGGCRGGVFESSKIENCRFVNADGNGSSVELLSSSEMRGCLIEGIQNATMEVLYVSGGSLAEDCQILGNTVNYSTLIGSNGGKLNRLLIKGNKSYYNILLIQNQSSLVSNCLIFENAVTSSSDIVSIYDGATMNNCTMARNSTTNRYVVYVNNSNLKNSIIVGNQRDGNYAGILNIVGTSTITNNMLESTALEGNFDGSMTYAAFTDAENGDYSLSANSYCINAGMEVSDSIDFLGNPRKQGGAVDLGAVESSYSKAPSFSCGDIVYVKAGATGNGSSWQSAFGDVQQAIVAASADGKKHQVWVAKGTYYGDTTLSTVVNLVKGISLYGGFAGNETSLSARDTALNPTILDGRDKRRVITQNYAFADSMAVVVDGFTIQKGYAAKGGGVNLVSNVTVNNCILRGNRSFETGSAIYADNSTVKNCQIVDNTYTGSLSYTVYLSHCVMEGCEVKGNRCRNNSAIYAMDNSTVTNCLVEGNISDRGNRRGSVFNSSKVLNCKFVNANGDGSSVELQASSEMRNCLIEGIQNATMEVLYVSGGSFAEDCRILGNSVKGALLYMNNGKLNRSLIKGNVISARIASLYSPLASITNCLIYENTGMSYEPISINSGATMSNCTMVRNSTASSVLVGVGDANLKNSIIVGNQRDGYQGGILVTSGTNVITNNMLESTALEGNFDGSMTYAAFTDAENGDYSLSANSYCINAGMEVSDSIDFLGNPRKQGGAVDLGAVESSYSKAPSFSCGDIVYVKAGATGNGSSWQSAFGDVQQAIVAASADGKKHQVWVAKGTYYGDTTLSTVVNLVKGISLYGGFAGNETSLSARDTVLNPTILDGRDKRRVITQNYAFADSMAVVVDGFTIQKGYAAKGGGVNLVSNVTVNNCILRGNRSSESGSAIYADNSTVKNCQIVANAYTGMQFYTVCLSHCVMDSCEVRGNRCWYNSAICATDNSTVTNCSVEDNISDRGNRRGSVFNSSKVRNCRFTNANGDGSSVELQVSSDMRDCLIEGIQNATTQVLYVSGGSLAEDCQILGVSGRTPLITLDNGKLNRLLIKGNRVAGSLLFMAGSMASTTNCLICENTEMTNIPVCIHNGATMSNCTVARNSTTSSEIVTMSDANLKNSIIVGNQRNNYYGGTLGASGVNTITNNMLESTSLDGNFDGSMTYAAFTDAENGDYSLSANSYCINAGMEVSDSIDFLGNPRKQGGAVDLGAVESSYSKAPSFSCGDIVYVKAGATGNGSSWQSAFGDVQQAIVAASADGKKHQVWVAKGTYYGDTTLATVVNLAKGISLYGGFAGNETSLAARDTALNPTILDGKRKGRVITQNYDFADSMAVVVDGFTIQNGYAAYGGGAYLRRSTTLNNCIVRKCTAAEQGLAVYSLYADVTNSVICDNGDFDYRGNSAGALYMVGGKVDRCVMKNNNSYRNSALCAESSTKITNSIFEGNESYRGSVISLNNSAISDCRIINNINKDNGNNHILVLESSTAERCILDGNESGSYLLYISNGSTVSNSQVAHCKSRSSCLVYIQSNSNMINCTVADNVSNNQTVHGNSRTQILNSIVVGNKRLNNSESVFVNGATIKYSMIEGGASGEGNIDGSKSSAAFVDPSNGDYSLSGSSLCINAGCDVADSVDLRGNVRKQSTAVDMGAIESAFTERVLVGPIIYVKAGSEGSGLNWDDALGEINQAVTLASTTGQKHQIWVAKGTYVGDTSLVSAISLAAGVSLYGGFEGIESSLEERDAAKNITIIDGKYKRRCIIQNYDFADSLAIVVDGFTIQNGFLRNNAGVNAYVKGNTTFSNCVFRSAREGNEGVYANKTAFKNCKFIENTIQELKLYGGTVEGCTFTGNRTNHGSAVVYISGAKMSNSRIADYAENNVVLNAVDRSVVSSCKIVNNETGNHNVVHLSNATLENSLVYGNAVRNGGSCLIAANYTSSITNSTIAHNTTKSNSTISYSSASSNCYATIANSIIYGNKVTDVVSPQVAVSDYIKVKYCASDGDLTGENNIRLATSNSGSDASQNYVCFINSAGGDYRLHATSACVDKGLDSLMKTETDLNGGARIYGKAIDLGAVEFDGEYVQMLDYSQPVCYNRYSQEATFDSTIAKIDWEIIYAGNVSGFENVSGSGTSIPSMRLRTSGSVIDTLILKVTPYDKAGVAGNPFNYRYFVYPDFSKKVVAITQPQVAYLVNEQSNRMTIEWRRLSLPVEVDRYDLYVWKSSQKVPTTPMASFVKGNSRQLTNLDNHTTYKYMVKAVIACDTISSEIDSFRIDIPVSLSVSGDVNCVFGSKLNETSSLTRYVKGFELTDSITYEITGRDAADFSARCENGWDKLNGGYLRIFYTPTDVKKQTSDAAITIRSGNSGRYEITLYLAGTLSNYYVYAATVGQQVYQAGDTVDVVGILTDAYGTPMAGKTLTIEANSNTGVSHSTTDVTDSTGRAAVRFATSKTEFGTYSVNVYVGSKTNGDALAKFDIPGMSYTGGTVKWTIQLGDTIEGSITMTNRSNIPLHNLVVESRELAEGLIVEFDTLALLHGYETARIPFRATGTKLTEGRLYLPSVFRVSCDEKTTSDFSTYFYCEQPYGQIKAFPSSINEYVSKQKPKYINIELTNAGFGETGAVTLSLPDFGGFSVPNTTLPSIKSGDTTRVSLRIAYFDGAPINVPFTGTIGVNCANGKSTSLPFRVEYSSESKGSLEVDVVDEYFYNTAEKRHLKDARVVVRNQYNNAEVASGYTDTTGVVRFDSIPEGTYLLSVKADKHSEYQETIEIQAGQKSSRFIFLAYQAITYTWNVERVEIEDRYDISLDLEYETNVPAPVVTLTFPNGVPDKSRFEVGVPKTVRLQITNHGLIAARYVKFAMPKVPYYRFYVPYDYIDSLPANHTEFVPVTIVRTENEFASSYDISGGNGLLLENESFGTSECPSVHAEYSYVCGVLRLLSTVSETAFPCPTLEPVTHGGGQGGWGGVDVPPYGGGSHKDEHQFGKVENHQYSVNLDIPCNTCLSKVDPWKCVGDILGYIPIVGPLLDFSIDNIDDAIKRDQEKQRKKQSCEQKDKVADRHPYGWIADLDAEMPEDVMGSIEGFVDASETKTFGEAVTDFSKFEVHGGVLNDVSEMQMIYKSGKLLDDFYNDFENFDPYAPMDLVYEEGKNIFDKALEEADIPIISSVPWDCLDMSCQLKSCEHGRFAENCGRYLIDRFWGLDEEDPDTRKTVTTEGDTVVIEDGRIVDVLYPDGDSLSAQNRSEKSKDAMIAKAKYNMPNGIYQMSDARTLAAHDAVEFTGFLQYRGNLMKELAGSERLLSQDGILDYFDYTIENYSYGEAIDIEAIKNLPTTGVSTTDLVGMALRWNETLLANENGVYSPNEEYPNIVDKSVIQTYMDSIVNFYTYLKLRGLGSVRGMMVSINEQVNKPVQKNVCATVKLHIAQTLTMAREAFDGTLTVNNGNESGAMEGFKVVLEVRDEKGNLSNDLFQINTEKLTGVSAIDGTGEIAPKSEGTALFRFIPEKGAAPTAPVNYSFGGHIIYVDPASGDTVTAQLYPVTLTVNPCPDLQIDYFMQRNILGDDALTLDRVEPSVPAALGVRIDNQGYGDAKKVKLETAQPEIVDNEKGLLIDFAIIGSSLNGKDCDLGSENIDFGDVEAHTAKTGVWWMTSSLLGHFTKYEASVVHANSYGNPDLSLVKGIAIHELIKTVDAYGAKEDGVVDFLVNGKKDEDDTPDTIYYSNGGKDPVHVVQWVTLDKEKVKPTDTVVRLTATPSDAGWNYARVNDPGDNCYEIQKVVRVKDSVEIPLDNVWTTFVTLPDGLEPIYVNHLHFLDYMTTMGENDYDIYYSVKKNVLVVTEISNVPTSANAVLTPVENVVVKFNRKIQKETFDYKDIELFCQGGDNLSDSTITVTQLDDYTYMVNIASKTNASGFFKIEVNVNNVLDQDGYAGTFGKNATWSQLVEGGNPGGGDNPGGEDNPGELTPVADIADDKVLVYAYRDGIYVKSAKPGALDIYDILSRLVVKNARYGEGVTMVATLPKGIYIINGKKVIVE